MSLTPFPLNRGRRGPDWRAFGERLDRNPTWRAARISATTIYALLLREAVTRYGRRSAGYVWSLIEPLLQLTVMLTVFGFIGRSPAVGESLVVFFITGIMPLMSFRNAINRGARAITSNRSLMNYPQVRAFEIITARVLLELLTSAMVVFIIALFTKAFFALPFTAWVDNPLELEGALLVLALLCYGAGFLSAQIGRFFNQWSDLTRALGRLLFFTSGVWYTLDTLPAGLRKYVAYNPLAQVIEWIRDAAIPGFESQHVSAFYPIAFAVVCLVIGLFIEWLFQFTGLELERG